MKKKLIVGVLSHVDSGGKDDIFPGRALHYIDRIYSDKLIEFGLIPLIIPVNNKSSEYIDFLLEMVDGILGTGGGKIPLNLLNQNTIPKLIETSPERYEFEKNFLLEAYKKNIPILGMCRSEQTLNELLGGSTISKIKTEITNSLEHNQKNLGIELTEPYHDIYLKENSIIKRIFQNDVIKVNSWHSQAVNEVGKGLIVTAKAQDGVIEVIESTEKDFVLLLQFHPEEMAVKDKKWDKIFLEFKSYVEKYNEKGDQKW